MITRQTPSMGIKAAGDLTVNIESFGRHLRAENLSTKTFEAYVGATRQLHQYLMDQGMPLNVGSIRREHVEAFITDLLEHWKPATAHNRFSGSPGMLPGGCFPGGNRGIPDGPDEASSGS